MSDSEEVKITFKPIKKKSLRQRKESSGEEESVKEDLIELESKLELINETKERQKLRNRSKGVNA